jgi:DNA replication protein DnaC
MPQIRTCIDKVQAGILTASRTPKTGIGTRRQRVALEGRAYLVPWPTRIDPQAIDPNLQALLDQLTAGELPWPLYLYGDTGRGKSCAVIALLNRVAYSAYLRLSGLIAEYIDRTTIWASYRDAPLVALDEVGCHRVPCEPEYQALKQLADIREGKPTIWISNLDPEVLCQHYDDRIYSRLCCGTWFKLEGPDRRFQQK